MRRLLIFPAIALIAVVALFEYRRYSIGDRELTQSELESLLRRQYALREISLAEGSSWTFTGSGIDVRDTRYHFAVVQDGRSRTVHHFWEDADRVNAGGNETTVEFSNPKLGYFALAGLYVVWITGVFARRNTTRVREPSVAAA